MIILHLNIATTSSSVSAQEAVLTVENLETTFLTQQVPVKAISGVSYSVFKQETVGIVGESGCGKSVTSLCVMGLLGHPGRISGGSILFKGQELTNLSENAYSQLRGNKVAIYSPAFSRHAPTCHDCHVAFVRARAFNCRRAHDGAGRDHSGPSD